MAGVVLADFFSAAESVAKSRMGDRRWSEASFSSRRGRRQVSLVLYSSRAAIRVALDSNASPAAAGSRLVALSSAGAASRRPGCRAVVLAKGRFIVPRGGHFSAASGFVLRGGRV